jgi:hypothetical protein
MTNKKDRLTIIDRTQISSVLAFGNLIIYSINSFLQSFDKKQLMLIFEQFIKIFR